MSYFIRAFCTAEKVPTIEEVIKWARLKGYNLRVDKSYSDTDITSNDWEEAAILNEDGKRAFTAEVNRSNGNEESLMQEEINEFKQIIQELEDVSEDKKSKVIKHLSETKYIIVNDLIDDELSEEDINASSIFLQYFVTNCGGMVQEDEEGFYEGDNVIIEIY